MAITQLTQSVTTLPTPPTTSNPVDFDSLGDAFLVAEQVMTTEIGALVTQLQTFTDEVNTTETNMSALDTNTTDNALVAQSAANYKGDWVAGFNTTGYALADSVSYTDGFNYVSKVDANLVEPTTKTNTTEWNYIEAVSPAELALKEDITANDTKLALKSNKANPIFTGSITEQVAVSNLAIDATNGTVQTYTAAANFTFTDALTDGQSITLILTNGGFTATYPATTWWGGAVPTLGTTDKIKFEKVGTTLYGTHEGSI